ncbi:class I SAM-dependent methyltransferase [Leptospira sp. GIMC2001]|uniref:class I SAM-dependent methyltransferase n=1 Tax=Leptospira sp. GIMC2001 TaxID=1513297 RepID=UPI00234B196F|nr:class I SAM-dependent methyltransferase [Leptospira sp. GIMC2001]WCL48079.1 class I SAM-dependent methyltransferase [Leptospira sp. GIMC2001]
MNSNSSNIPDSVSNYLGSDKNCPLTGDCSFQFLYRSTFSNFDLPIYECKKCLIQKQSPIPLNPDELYDENYYSGLSTFSYQDERKTYKFHSYVWDSRLAIICRFKKSGKILEIGSSFGGFLSRAKKFGFEVFGLEISKYSCDYANSQGIPTIYGKLEDTNFQNQQFDAIVLTEVIEHLENPKFVFDELSRVLKNDGLLILQTANFEGWQAKNSGASYHYYLPGHLYYYGENNLKNILKLRGFDRFKVFYGSDVSLISKLKKSRGNFQNLLDYAKWIKTIIFHFKSKLKKSGYPLTSGFVIYCFKGGSDTDNDE